MSEDPERPRSAPPQVGPGLAFVVLPERPWPVLPVITDVPFEPAYFKDRSALHNLVRLNGSEIPGDAGQEARDRVSKWLDDAIPGDSIPLVFVACIVLLFALFWGWHGLQAAVKVGTFFGALVGLPWLLSTLLQTIFPPLHWWIVPGGIVRLRHATWCRAAEVSLLTPENASLLVHRGRQCDLIKGSDIVRIFFPEYLGPWCTLFAWISTARTPTLEEVRSLLDPEGDDAGGASEAPPTERVE